MLNFEETMIKEEARIQNPEQILGKCLDQPFTTGNSGSRKLLYSTQKDHALCLINPETPIIQTGFENRFGDEASSIIQLDDAYEVLDKIEKFSRLPNHDYILILRNIRTNQLHMLHRVSYGNLTESFGYLKNNSVMDSLEPEHVLEKGTIVSRSNSYDDSMNRCDGVNLLTAYISSDKTMEDGILISESASEKLAAPLISIIEIQLNDNDIILNLYGDDEEYRGIPFVGDKVKDGIVCAIRRENAEDSLYTESRQMLKQILMSDTKYLRAGDVTVVDLDIHSNNPDSLRDKHSNAQLNYYYEDKQRYLYEIIKCVEKYKSQGFTDLSDDLDALYEDSKREFHGTEFMKDKSYSGTILKLVLYERKKAQKGDKISNRYGGKGVISKVLPDHMMPIIKGSDKHVELCFNSLTCVNRLNDGQLKEISLTHIGSRVLEFVHAMFWDSTEDSINEIIRFVSTCSPTQGDMLRSLVNSMDSESVDVLLQSFYDDESIIISLLPATESLTLDDMDRIYKEFPYAAQYNILAPILDSNGNVRYVDSRRSLVCGKAYIYRLKQYAEEKFIVTSLSSVNIRNENTRSKSAKKFKSLHSSTPIKFGDMESNDFGHVGMEYIITILMIYSVSPEARRLVEEILVDDPYDIDIKLDDNSINRTAQVANVYLKAMGYRLNFTKKLKKVIRGILTKGVTYNWGEKLLREGIKYINPEETGFNIEEDIKRMLEVENMNRGVFYEGVGYDED